MQLLSASRKAAILSSLATAIAAIVCAVNLLFFFSFVVLAVAATANIAVSLQYQSALPVNTGAAIACCILNAVASPWLVAMLSAVVDFSKWPVRYGVFRKTLLQLFRGCAGSSVTRGSAAPAAATAAAPATATALAVNSGTGSGLSSGSGLQQSSPGGVSRDEWEHTVDASGDDASGECCTLEHCFSRNVRRVIVYTMPLLVWAISTAVEIGTASNSFATGFFIALSFAMLVALCFVNTTLEWRPIETSSFLFTLSMRGYFPVVCIVSNCVTLTAVVAQEKDMIRGGDSAIAATYIFSAVYALAHFALKLHDDAEAKRSTGERLVFRARSLRTAVCAAVELVSLLIAGILIAVSYTPATNCIGVFIFLGIVALTYAWLMQRDVVFTVSLDVDDDDGLSAHMTAQERERGSTVALVEQEERGNNGSINYAAIDAAPNDTTQSMFRYDNNAAVAAAAASQAEQDSFAASSSAAGGGPVQVSSSHSSTIGATSGNEVPLVSRCSDMHFEDDGDGSGGGAKRGGASRRRLGAGGAGGAAAARTMDNEEGDREAITQRLRARRISLFLVGLAMTVVMLSSLINTLGTGNRPCAHPGRFPGRNDSADVYAACDMQHIGNFSTVDFAAFCSASYFYDAEFNESLSTWWPGDNASIVGSSDSSGSAIAVHYYSLLFPRRNTIVVLVRGSSISLDWMTDVFLSSDAVSIQIGTALLPVFAGLEVKATLVDLLSRATKLGSSTYTDAVAGEVERVRRLFPQHQVVLTGHSLAGHVVNTVAALTHTRSVAVSPFGTGMQYLRRGFSLESANELILSLIPRGDLVPEVDVQLGATQRFTQLQPCSGTMVNFGTNTSDGKTCVSQCGGRNAMCHSIMYSTFTLGAVCGDPLGRYVVPKKQACPRFN